MGALGLLQMYGFVKEQCAQQSQTIIPNLWRKRERESRERRRRERQRQRQTEREIERERERQRGRDRDRGVCDQAVEDRHVDILVHVAREPLLHGLDATNVRKLLHAVAISRVLI